MITNRLRQFGLAALGYFRPPPRSPGDPEGSLRSILERQAFTHYRDGVTENLTGLVSRIYEGETAPAQRIVSHGVANLDPAETFALRDGPQLPAWKGIDAP